MKPSLLIVDDHFSICCSLGKLLYKEYTVHRALNGKDALEIFRKNSDIDIILTDINMPVMDGIELIENVRIDNKDVIIIVMTAVCTDKILSEVIAKGANQCLMKPLDIPQLKLTLKKSIENRRTANTKRTIGSTYITPTKIINKQGSHSLTALHSFQNRHR
jgi:two-component system NtrC family response regulator